MASAPVRMLRYSTPGQRCFSRTPKGCLPHWRDRLYLISTLLPSCSPHLFLYVLQPAVALCLAPARCGAANCRSDRKNVKKEKAGNGRYNLRFAEGGFSLTLCSLAITETSWQPKAEATSRNLAQKCSRSELVLPEKGNGEVDPSKANSTSARSEARAVHINAIRVQRFRQQRFCLRLLWIAPLLATGSAEPQLQPVARSVAKGKHFALSYPESPKKVF